MGNKFKLIREIDNLENRNILEMHVNGQTVDFQKVVSKKIKGTVDCQSRIKDLELAESKLRIALNMVKDKGYELGRIDKDNEAAIICLSLIEAAIFSYARCFADGLKSKLNYKTVFQGDQRLINNHLEIRSFRHDGLAHPRDMEITDSGSYVYIDEKNNFPDLHMIVNCEYRAPSFEFLDNSYELIQFTKKYLITKQKKDIDNHMKKACQNPEEYGIKEIVERLLNKVKIIKI